MECLITVYMLNYKKSLWRGDAKTLLIERCLFYFCHDEKCCSIDFCSWCSFMINPRYKYVVCIALKKTIILVNAAGLCITGNFFQLYSPALRKENQNQLTKKTNQKANKIKDCNQPTNQPTKKTCKNPCPYQNNKTKKEKTKPKQIQLKNQPTNQKIMKSPNTKTKRKSCDSLSDYNICLFHASVIMVLSTAVECNC